MGKVEFTTLKGVASQKRLRQWYDIQLEKQKPIYYLLPSMKWFQYARKNQPGIAFQSFDELAILLLQSANVDFTAISDSDRVLLFYEIINGLMPFLSEKELSQQAVAYSATYGQLKRLGLTIEDTPQQLQELIPIFKIYEQEYRDNRGLFDPENRISAAVENAAKLVAFPLSAIVIDGFMDFSPIQYVLIQYIQLAAIPFTIYLPALDTPIIAETRAMLEKIGVEIGGNDEAPPQPVICQMKELTTATTVEEEIDGVLETIFRLKQKCRYDKFGIVMANEEKYIEEIQQLGRQKQIPIKRPFKKRLSETMFLELLHIALDLNEVNTKWELLPLVDTASKLIFLTPNEFSKLKEQFIEHNEITNHNVRSIIDEAVDFQRLLKGKKTISAYNTAVLTFIENLLLPSIWKELIKRETYSNKKQVALEIRAYHRVKELLEDKVFTENPLAVSEVIVNLDSYKEWILAELEEETLYLDRAPRDGIELYSFRDVPLFNGEHLFIVGLNEGEFPKQVKLSGYFQERYMEDVEIPYPLPTSSYFRLKDDASFAQLNYLAQTLSFSYVEGMNPNQPQLPSKYLLDSSIDVLPKSYSTITRLERDSYQTRREFEEKLAFHEGLGKTLFQIPENLTQYRGNLDYLQKGTEEVSKKWWDKFSSNTISITALERYASCSFRFALERILKVKAPVEEQTRVDPLETGNMLHRIIETFYRKAKGVAFSELEPFFHWEAENRLMQIFEQEWEEIVQKHQEVSLRTLSKSKEEWERKLGKWLAAERSRFWENEQLSNMTIFQLEEPVKLDIELPTGEVITLSGKIDRIDIDEHGFVIYDYKSSDKVLNFEKEIPAGVVLQIPLYMMALEYEFKKGRYKTQVVEKSDAIGGGYISIKNPNLRKKNTVWKNEEHKVRFEPRFQTNIEEIHSEALSTNYNIPALIEKLWQGTSRDFSVKPYSSQTCKFCDFKSICRVRREQQDAEEGVFER